MDEDKTPDLEEDEHSLFDLMSALRDYTIKVSSAFVERVSDELDRAAADKGPGVTSVVGGVLVQMLNLVYGALGFDDETDGEEPLDEDNRSEENDE